MKRRGAIVIIAALGVAAWHLPASAQMPRRIEILGVTAAESPGSRELLKSVRAGLAGRALAEGKAFAIRYTGEPRIERAADRVHELLARNPGLIIAVTTPVAQAAARATREVPILFTTVSDPVGSGLVASLARPGGNVTGVSNMLPELSGKLLELVREVLPGAAPVAVLWNPDNPAKALELRELRLAAATLGVALRELPARSLPEIERALSEASASRSGALLILAETLTDLHKKRIAELTLAGRMAVFANYTPHTEAGGLLSYSPDYQALTLRAGALAAKIIAGARPADLAVELPSKFELVINLKAAKALRITIPQSVLLRADRVIE